VTDEAFAVIDQQPQVEFGPVQMGDRKRCEALAQRGPGHVDRVDAVGLAALSGALARLGHQVGRDAQHPLAALDQEPLEGPRHMPAIFQRPDTLTVELSRPREERREPRAANLNRALAHQLARRRADAGDRVRALVRVRTEHDHDSRPPL
jgi:hypothetical protein